MYNSVKISVEDALRLEISNLKKALARCQAEIVEKDEQLLHANLRSTYGLRAGDEINPQTLEIVRKPEGPKSE